MFSFGKNAKPEEFKSGEQWILGKLKEIASLVAEFYDKCPRN
jgi:hypothetical protein